VIDESLSFRLAVVVQQKYRTEAEQDSYLNLGPIRRAQSVGLMSVIDPDVDLELREADYEATIESLHGWLPLQHKREKLRSQDRAHIFLLIADLADILLIATETDLIEAIRYFGVSIQLKELQKFLGLLKFLGLVRLYQHGSAKYWLREGDHGPWIDYTSSSDLPFDRSRFKIKAEQNLEKNSQRLFSIYLRARK